MAKKNQHTLEDVFKAVKERLINNNLSLKEISDSMGVSEEILDIFFDESNNVVSDLSNLIAFSKTVLTFRQYQFRPFIITEEKEYIKITKTLVPKCSVYYSKISEEFYRFYTPHQKNLTEEAKQVALNEMHDKIKEYIGNRDKVKS